MNMVQYQTFCNLRREGRRDGISERVTKVTAQDVVELLKGKKHCTCQGNIGSVSKVSRDRVPVSIFYCMGMGLVDTASDSR